MTQRDSGRPVVLKAQKNLITQAAGGVRVGDDGASSAPFAGGPEVFCCCQTEGRVERSFPTGRPAHYREF